MMSPLFFQQEKVIELCSRDRLLFPSVCVLSCGSAGWEVLPDAGPSWRSS